MIHQIETIDRKIKQFNKLKAHNMRWRKCSVLVLYLEAEES